MSTIPEFSTAEAIAEAIAVLTERAGQTDSASPAGWRARCALEALEALDAQFGCEGFDPAVKDGKLTTLCDVVICG